jgi:hypothetical protein
METTEQIRVKVEGQQQVVNDLRKRFDKVSLEVQESGEAISRVHENVAAGTANEVDARTARDLLAAAKGRRDGSLSILQKAEARLSELLETQRLAWEAEAEAVRAADLHSRKEHGRAIAERILAATEALVLASREFRDSNAHISARFGPRDAAEVFDRLRRDERFVPGLFGVAGDIGDWSAYQQQQRRRVELNAV